MGESLSTWTPSCNGAVRVELSGQRTTSDSGALLLREALWSYCQILCTASQAAVLSD
jgi:hypothetical protein